MDQAKLPCAHMKEAAEVMGKLGVETEPYGPMSDLKLICKRCNVYLLFSSLRALAESMCSPG